MKDQGQRSFRFERIQMVDERISNTARMKLQIFVARKMEIEG